MKNTIVMSPISYYQWFTSYIRILAQSEAKAPKNGLKLNFDDRFEFFHLESSFYRRFVQIRLIQ